MSVALLRHDALLRAAIEAQEGVVFKTMGDAFCTAFATATQALDAALSAQRALQSEVWPAEASLRVRMALHTGTAEERDGDYYGQPLNRVARLLSAGHGGQTLLSQTTYELIRDALPPLCTLQDLGSHSLRDLARPEQVYQLLQPALFREFPALKSLDYLPNNLPQQMTSFIGREKELVRVKDLLDKTRLLTLTGSGGCGKTRLSLQAAADVLDSYPDGVWLVELAPLTDPTLVPQAVANVLGISEQSGLTLTQTLTDWLKPKHLLLILDNCEHLLSASAGLADLLLRACPQLRILASSREGLGITGELTYRVPSLSLPDPKTPQTADSLSQYEAVQLFIQRAQFHRSDFAVTNANAPAVASICHRVDGIPLALELAAARLRSLSVEEVNDRLDNRFRLLTGGPRTALPRQQTLRALIDWSYDLLTGPEKSLLGRLSVFSGGWTLAAVEQVVIGDDIEDWEILDLLTSLVDKSLVFTEEQEAQTRYRFLETVRQYARDKLAESNESASVRDKHAAYFLAVAEEAFAELGTPEQSVWLTRLETEHDNLRSALAWFLEIPEGRGAMAGLRLGNALLRFWLVRGYLNEARRHIDAILAAPGAQAETIERARALIGAGTLAQTQGDNPQAKRLYRESLTLARTLGDSLQIADALGNLGTVLRNEGDYAEARRMAEESLAIARVLEDRSQTALALADLGMIAANQGEYAQAQVLIEECLAFYQEIGHKRAIAHFSEILGSFLVEQGEHDQGRVLIEESLRVHRELGYRIGISAALVSLGYLALRQGDYALARTVFVESQAIDRELGNNHGIAVSLLCLARIALDLGDPAQAQVLLAESMLLQHELDHKMGMAEAQRNLGLAVARQGHYAQGRAHIEEGLMLSRELEQPRGIAAALVLLATIALDHDDLPVAQLRLGECLTAIRAFDSEKSAVEALEACARLRFVQDHPERAARLWGSAAKLREALRSPLPPVDQVDYDTMVAAARAKLGDDLFASAWAEGQALTWEQAIEEALVGD